MAEQNNILKPNSPLFNSPYIVEKDIGSGGDGTVYIVHNKNNPTVKYAAKVFKKPEKLTDDYWIKRSNEALTAIRISQKDNPNLAKTYDAFVGDDNQIIFIMEYIDGVTLRNYLQQQYCLTPKVALNIFKKMLNGIKQLHHYKQTIIHRDLKPENIMVSHDLSRVIIVDFGISTVVTKDMDNARVLTNEIEFYGTESYIFPDLFEEFTKKGKVESVSVQSDFYSLGVILYEMIMGKWPFDQIIGPDGKVNKIATIRLAKTYDMINISANPTIPPTLENIIFKCIACKPHDIKYRYTDIDQIIDDVDKCLLLLDKKNDNTPLLKPISQRLYQSNPTIDVEITKNHQRWYKQWWFFAVLFVLVITIIIVAIFFFFII